MEIIDCNVILHSPPEPDRAVIFVPTDNWISPNIAYYKSSSMSNIDDCNIIRSACWFPIIGIFENNDSVLANIMEDTNGWIIKNISYKREHIKPDFPKLKLPFFPDVMNWFEQVMHNVYNKMFEPSIIKFITDFIVEKHHIPTTDKKNFNEHMRKISDILYSTLGCIYNYAYNWEQTQMCVQLGYTNLLQIITDLQTGERENSHYVRNYMVIKIGDDKRRPTEEEFQERKVQAYASLMEYVIHLQCVFDFILTHKPRLWLDGSISSDGKITVNYMYKHPDGRIVQLPNLNSIPNYNLFEQIEKLSVYTVNTANAIKKPSTNDILFKNNAVSRTFLIDKRPEDNLAFKREIYKNIAMLRYGIPLSDTTAAAAAAAAVPPPVMPIAKPAPIAAPMDVHTENPAPIQEIAAAAATTPISSSGQTRVAKRKISTEDSPLQEKPAVLRRTTRKPHPRGGGTRKSVLRRSKK